MHVALTRAVAIALLFWRGGRGTQNRGRHGNHVNNGNHDDDDSEPASPVYYPRNDIALRVNLDGGRVFSRLTYHREKQPGADGINVWCCIMSTNGLCGGEGEGVKGLVTSPGFDSDAHQLTSLL